jgi:hypothetical protein
MQRVSDMNPKLKRILHLVSLTGTHMMVIGFFLCIQQYTIGLLPGIRNLYLFEIIPIPSVIFLITSFYLTKRFFKISSPYKD